VFENTGRKVEVELVIVKFADIAVVLDGLKLFPAAFGLE
jgi:hypothetical protein